MQPRPTQLKRLATVLVAMLCVTLLTSCATVQVIVGSIFGPGDDEISHNKMALIVDALNDHDADALKAVFTDYARTEFSQQLDAGANYLFSLFPDGDISWDESEDGTSGSSGAGDGNGGIAELVPSYYHVMSGGQQYELFFADFTFNTIDPSNVGIYALGAVLETEAGDSGPEAARYDWSNVMGDIDAERDPGIFIAEDGAQSRGTASQIVDALNHHDKAALTGLFSALARAQHPEAIAAGLDYLLSVFPDGGVTVDLEHGGSGVLEHFDAEGTTVMLRSFYRVSAGGVDYRLYFADFTENPGVPSNVGIYAMGVAPAAETRNTVPEWNLFDWADELDFDVNSPPGVYVPTEVTADARMAQIAAALETHDATALESLFSRYSRDTAPDLDGGIDYLFSLIPTGPVTWTEHDVDHFDQAKSGDKSEVVKATYRVTAGGKDYRLYFSDFPVNDVINPDNVGLFALGVISWTDDPENGCGDPFFEWTCSMSLDGTTDRAGFEGYAGVFVP